MCPRTPPFLDGLGWSVARAPRSEAGISPDASDRTEPDSSSTGTVYPRALAHMRGRYGSTGHPRANVASNAFLANMATNLQSLGGAL